MRNRQSGVSLLELLVSIVVVSIVTVITTRAIVASLDFERGVTERRTEEAPRKRLEERLVSVLRNAFVSTDQADTATFFTTNAFGEGASDGADNIVFTSRGERLASHVLASEDEFEAANERLGPQGGIVEVSLSTTSEFGGSGQTGLFLREQRPSDGDPTQGGNETLLEPLVTALRFEFYDGAAWVSEWDTAETGRRIPSAILVHYTLNGEPERTLFVRLPMSDVTPDNPVTIGEGQP